jgi:hypothetical protein
MRERKYKIENNRLVKRSTGVPVSEDEPLFIFRAKDRKALPALLAYVQILDDFKMREEAMKDVQDFREFQENHPELMAEPTP